MLREEEATLIAKRSEIARVLKKKGEVAEKQQRINQIKQLDGEISAKRREIRNTSHRVDLLEEAVKTGVFSKSLLVSEVNFPGELIDRYQEEFPDLDALIAVQNRIALKEEHWAEIIFFKIVSLTKTEIIGKVIDRFKQPNSKCSLKEGDTISFKPKQILFVPTMLNKKSKLAAYVKAKRVFEFYETDVVTDWDGVFLDPAARDLITLGSVVRVQFRLMGTLFGDVWYARVLETSGDVIYGELLDYYKIDFGQIGDDSILPGLIVRFGKRNIIEIPLMWNTHLKAAERLRNRGRFGYSITGYRGEGTYSRIEVDE